MLYLLSGCVAARHHADQPECLSDLPVNLSLCVLQIQKRHSSSSIDERPSPSSSAREYVESLHQNSRVTLLFGKNNVLVQPVTACFPSAFRTRVEAMRERWVNTRALVAVSEGRHGGRAGLPLSAPERRLDDPEVDAKSAHERLRRRPGLRAQVRYDIRLQMARRYGDHASVL